MPSAAARGFFRSDRVIEAGNASKWNRTISAVLPAVVSIKVNRVRAFDHGGLGLGAGDGFVASTRSAGSS